jgi:hypothetical protein
MLAEVIAGPTLKCIGGICVSTFHEKVERLKSAISKAEMFVNQGGDLQGPQAGSVKAEVVDAWDEFSKEFVDASVQSDA